MEHWGNPVTHSEVKDETTGLYIIWCPSQVRVENGICNLVTERDHNPGEPYTKSGMITTFKSLNQLYGYFEVKMKVSPGGVNAWTAFWAWAVGDDKNPIMECDIAEFTEPDSSTYTSTIHKWSPIHSGLAHSTAGIKINYTFWQEIKNFFIQLFTGKVAPEYVDLSKDFHTYALEWNKDEMIFYLDDAVQYTFPNYINSPMYFIINNGVKQGFNPPDSFYPVDMQIEYFRAYKKKS